MLAKLAPSAAILPHPTTTKRQRKNWIIAVVLVSVAYIAFAWSMSEASGALPFAGGAYGLARCTIGFYPAFLVGCCQIMQYILAVAIAIGLLMPMIVTMNPQVHNYEPLIMALLYGFTLIIQIRGGRIFWGMCWLCGVYGLVAILLYAIGNFANVDFQKNAVSTPQDKYINGARGFFDGMPFLSCFLVGIEALNLASSDVAQPKTAIPRAQMTCLASMLVTSLLAGFIAVSLPGATLQLTATLAPLNDGFSRVLPISDLAATGISLLPTYSVAFGFMWAYARLIKSMATSKLLPPILGTTNRFGTPWVAHLVGSIIGYAMCLAINYVPIVIYVAFPLMMAFSFLSYI